jgi:hypothetical protein
MLTNISTRFINVENEDIDVEINTVLKQIDSSKKSTGLTFFQIDQKNSEWQHHEWCRDGIAPKNS